MFILRSTSAHAKIDNATKVFFHDFIVQFAVRLERVVLRQLPLRFRLRQGCGATSWGKEIRGQNVKGFAHVPGRTEEALLS